MMKEITTTLTQRSQVTVPAEVRQAAGVEAPRTSGVHHRRRKGLSGPSPFHLGISVPFGKALRRSGHDWESVIRYRERRQG